MESDTAYTNGWNEYKKLVLKQLEGLLDKTDDIDAKMTDLKEKLESRIDNKTQYLADKIERVDKRVVILETKAVAYGALAALVVTILIEVATKIIFK